MNTGMRELATGLWDQWAALWNGDLSLGEKILGDDFAVIFGSATAAESGGDDLRGGAATAAYIGAFRARYASLVYRTEVGPFVDMALVDGVPTGHLVCRWRADVTDADGGSRVVAGHDILRIEGERITYAWSVTGVRDLTGIA